MNSGLRINRIHSLLSNDSLLFAGSDGAGLWYRPLSDIVPPGKPTLLAPYPGDTTDYSQLRMTWHAVKGALLYQHQQSTDSLFASGVIFEETITNDTALVARSLKPDTTYYWRVSALGTAGQGEWSDVWYFSTRPSQTGVTSGLSPGLVPREFALEQNFPNPFNSSTTFTVAVPFLSNATIEVHTALGQLVTRVFTEDLPTGRHLFRWNGKNDHGLDVSSGVLFLRLSIVGQKSYSKRIVLTR